MKPGSYFITAKCTVPVHRESENKYKWNILFLLQRQKTKMMNSSCILTQKSQKKIITIIKNYRIVYKVILNAIFMTILVRHIEYLTLNITPSNILYT